MPKRYKAEKILPTRKEKKLVSTDAAAKTSKNAIKINEQGQVVVAKGDKLSDFLEEFINNGGNATRAAAKVFNCKTLGSAAWLGHSYLKKAKMAGRLVMEKQGYTLQKMLEVAAEKMEKSKSPDWWDRLMKMGEYEDFMTKKQAGGGGVNVNVFQAHKDFISGYVEGETQDIEPVNEEVPEDENQLP